MPTQSKHNRYPPFLKQPLACLCAAVPLMALGQDEPLKVASSIEEIVVTAQKKAESLQDAPISIAAFSSDMLEDIGAFNATDVGEYTPNVDIYNTLGSSNNITVNIRGIGTAEASLSIDPKTGIYLDGVYIARNAGAVFDIVDLERIEVLRGPQGTLWGKNTTGGAMLIVTKKPSGEFGVQQRLSFANDGYFRSVSTIDTPMVGDVSAKFSYMHKSYDGFAKNTYPGAEMNLGSESVDAARLSIAWSISDSTELLYNYDQTDSAAIPKPLQITDIGPGSTITSIYNLATDDIILGSPLAEMATIAEGSKRLEQFNLDQQGTEYVDISGHTLTLSTAINDIEIRSITAYRDYRSDFLGGLDLDGGAWNGINLATSELVSTPVFHSYSEKSQEQFSQEFQVVGSAMDASIDYVAGLYYFREDGSDHNPWDTTTYLTYSPVLLRGIPMGSWYSTDNESLAAYGQISFFITESLSLTYGGRYTEDKKAVTLLDDNPLLADEHTAKNSWRKFTSSLTLDYQASDDASLYAKVSEGYNAGVFNPGAIDSNSPQDFSVFNVPADEEETTAFELGMKSTWFDNRLRFNGAVFYNDNSNLQVTDFVNGVRTTINSGESVTKGFEFDVLAMPLPGLMIDAAYGYVESHYDDSNTLVDDGEGRGTGRFGASYSFPIMNIGMLNARIDSTYSGRSYYQAASPYAVGQSYSLLNARLTLSEIDLLNGSASISLWGKNLQDKHYRLHGTDFGMDEGFGYSAHVFGDPRSIGIDINFDY